jgi:hypothetical protein
VYANIFKNSQVNKISNPVKTEQKNSTHTKEDMWKEHKKMLKIIIYWGNANKTP